MTVTVPELEGSQALDPSDSPAHQTETLPLSSTSLTRYPLFWHSPSGVPICWVHCWPHTEKVGLTLPVAHLAIIMTHVDSQEVEAKSEHSSRQGEEDMPVLALGARPSSWTARAGTHQSPFQSNQGHCWSQWWYRGGSLKEYLGSGKWEQHWPQWDLIQLGHVQRECGSTLNMEAVSRDCVTCSDTDEVTIRTTHKKYWKRVWASCHLDKGNLWSEAQLKWISDSHQAMWGHDQEVIRMDQDCTLKEDHNSFEMHQMTVRTDQLLYIAEATDTKVYTCELEAEACGQMKALALSLKQYHAHYYQLYKERTTRAMVGLQGLHSGDAFRHSNVSSSVELKLFCPWCFKLGGNTKMIATYIQEVHYRLAIACHLCKSFTSMSTWSVLEHHSGCKVKHTKECLEQEGKEKARRSHKKKSKAQTEKIS